VSHRRHLFFLMYSDFFGHRSIKWGMLERMYFHVCDISGYLSQNKTGMFFEFH